MPSEIFRAPRRLLLALLFIAAGATANAQCYQFSGSGVSLQINISAIAPWIGPTSVPGGGFTSNGFFSSTNTFTAGGATLTSQATSDGAASISYTAASGPNPAFTNLHIIVPTNQPDTLSTSYSWSVTLFGAGNLIPSGTLPQVLPPISQWVYQTAEEVIGVLSGPISGPSTALYTITSVTSCTGSTGGGGSNSVSGKSLGNPASQPWCPVCGYPIDLGTGNMFEEADDYTTFGANTLAFTRYYNSLTSGSTLALSLGQNWRSNYDRYLDLSSASVIAERPDGQRVTFTPSGGGWTTDTDIDLTLTNSGSTWTLTDHNDNVETYTAIGASEGLLQTIKARNGYTQSLQYNSSNQVTSVTDSFNRQLTFTYSGGLLQSVATPDGLVLTYSFTAISGSYILTSVSYSTTPVTGKTYLYENSSLPAALTAIIDENGARYMGWTYDSRGRALTSQRAGGVNLTTIAYNDSDGSRMVTNALGEQALYKFSTLQSLPKVIEADRIAAAGIAAATSTYTYDSNGYMASQTDWKGNLTTFVNDPHGEPTTMNEAVGTAQARTSTVTYHPAFRLPIQIVTPGVTASFTYDSAGEPLTRTLTDTTTATVPYPTNGQTRTWTYTWSNFLLASVQGPRTDVAELTKFGYDSSGALTSVTNALNQTTRVTHHLPGGLPQTIVDPNAVTANLAYDARQRLLTSALTTSAGVLTTTLTYDAAGNVLSTTLPDGSSMTNTYDPAHRLTNRADKLGNAVAFTLDAFSDITQFTVVGSGNSTQLKRAGVYDALGRVLQAIGGAGQTASFAYDSEGNAQTVTDPLNRVTQQSFDALNRRVQITDPATGVSSISYDSRNRPVSVKDPNGVTTTYTYNGFGDLIQQVSPAAGTIVYRTDAAGNVVQKIDARGIIANYTYDAADRILSVNYPGNSAENITYTYDESGHGFGVGRLTSLSDASGALSRSYDERGNVLSETRKYPTATLVTSYTYDAVSRISSITYPRRWSVTYTRDAMGRITAATAQAPAGAAKPVISSVTYLPFGPINGLTYGNGIVEHRSFDLDYRLSTISSANVQSLTYSYDASDNVLAVSNGLNSANSQTLSYDALNRLTGASGAYGNLAYTYDGNGNRLSETSSATNDGLGPVATLTYNQSGSLAGVFNSSQQLTVYTYDAFMRRVMKVGSATGTTLYQYDPRGLLLEESDGQGNAQVDYIYLGRQPVAAIQSDGSLYFLHNDRLGTPQAATDGTQSIAWSATYQPFGQTGTAIAPIVQDLRLPGQELDLETGLYHNGFRDYVPTWGAYQRSDPAGLMGGLNTYAYAGGNPLRFTDPFGLDCPFAAPVSVNLMQLAQQIQVGADQINLDLLNAQAGLANFGADFAQGATTALEVVAAPFLLGGIVGGAAVQQLADTSAGEYILTGADFLWGSLTIAVERAAGTNAGEAAGLANVGVGLGVSGIGVAMQVAEAAPRQRPPTLLIATTAAIAGTAAAVLVAGVAGPAVLVGGAAAATGFAVNALVNIGYRALVGMPKH